MIVTICSNIALINFLHIIREALLIIQIAGPIVLILSLYINFTRGTVNPDNSSNGKINKNIMNSIIATVLLFFLPFIFNLVMIILENSGIAPAVDLGTCWEESERYYKIQDNTYKDPGKKENKGKLQTDTSVSNTTVSKKSVKKIKQKSKSKKKKKKTVKNGKKHKLSKKDAKYLAAICMREQGSIAGMKGEAHLIVNRYELFGKNYSSIVDYVKHSGWFGHRSVTPSNNKKAINVVESIIEKGNREIPVYVDEHDCWFCNSKPCKQNSNKGDICTITGGHSRSYITNRRHYHQDKTKITNVYGSKYTFYYFPASNSDPFGYTKAAYNKWKAMNK